MSSLSCRLLRTTLSGHSPTVLRLRPGPLRALTTNFCGVSREARGLTRGNSTIITTTTGTGGYRNGGAQQLSRLFSNLNRQSGAQIHRSVYRRRDGDYKDMVRRFIGAYRLREREFFFNLSESEKAGLDLEMAPDWFAAVNFRFYLEVLLTLLDRKPCVFFFYNTTNSQPVLNRLVTTLLKPMVEEYALEDFGYALRRIEHQLVTPEDEDWHGAWVFYDKRSFKQDEIESLFFKEQENDVLYKASNIARVLGYPMYAAISSNEKRYLVTDKTETRELANVIGHYVGEVAGVDYFGPGTALQAENAWDHFDSCREAALSVGRELGFSVLDGPNNTYHDPDVCLDCGRHKHGWRGYQELAGMHPRAPTCC